MVPSLTSLRSPDQRRGLHRSPQIRDFPGVQLPVVRNPPSNVGDVGSIPGWGTKIPHATEGLSLHATVKTQHSQR